MIQENNNFAATIEFLADRANAIRMISAEAAAGAVSALAVLPKDSRVEDLEQFLPKPRRIRKNIGFISIESFIRYVNEFKGSGTRILVDRSGNAHCVLDGHHVEAGDPVPAWGDHIARFQMKYSPQWAVWSQHNKRKFSQREFAGFIEDNIPDFLSPAGAHMLDVAKTLDAEQSSNFKSAIRTEDNDVNVSFERTTNLKAGQNGDMIIPHMFTISVPVIEGESPRAIEVRLRIDLDDGKLSISYEILRLQQLMDAVVRSIYATIANATEVTPFLVERAN